ncbi:enoyl-CoA hydratase/carnithine racemase [Sphingomonas jinjuensis]|uniref:Enoyl-CoA hydratase/carnithine racemase n=1 Tax=Sphingomonas jinjuensis TaxID=535907 RepID=A0A840FH99_9SPHN|nr:crotonase/enoyl-CoA hydratase family protein [Sphingomonas jinjuensis]MBB4155094.1 enoyl-CoA hydratase/carnithine racemase [Sphingomonas jinjuensis]
MTYQFIRFEVSDQIATVTLDRPDVMNAMHRPMIAELIRAFDQSDADDAVRAVIVTGAGRAFCAGADLSKGTDEFEKSALSNSARRPDGSFDYSAEAARDGGGSLALRIYNSRKPIIAAINGAAVGIGASMTLPMDVRLASENAKLGFVYARRGIVHECCSSFFLPRVVGISRALEWSMSGRVMPALELKDGGLVRDVLSPDELLPAARAIAAEIAGHTAPVSIALMRQMLWRGLEMSHPMEAHRVESRGILTRGRSADAKEGVASFVEKRAPHFPQNVTTDMPDYFPWWEEPRYS